MCEKRTGKITKGSQMARVREARRLQRLNRIASTSTTEQSNPAPCPNLQAQKAAQNRVILELAWKTIALMHKNRLIQQKIIALQKETSEFVASVMNNPENRQRYMEQIRLHVIAQQMQRGNTEATNKPLEVEPNVQNES
ncbi:unnamed protein product [Parnassius apollo]|uniref:(apollo) hypothetical protein n=1 Tax=Parnassius apollo TaxID=110799 RepID=A0A8S3WYL4_PARAO|nr:unnamed protein product [Parnassius apollo]